MSFPVTFFYPYPNAIARMRAADLQDHRVWSHPDTSRRRVWLVQTYLWLRRFGYDVAISPVLPAEGAVVLLPEPPIERAFLRQYTAAHRSLLIVTIRADIVGYRPSLADVDVTQNGRFADGTRTVFIPHWPQPGLLPRNPDRGTTVRNVVFKGGAGSLSAAFQSPAWRAALGRRGLRFRVDHPRSPAAVPDWHDYRTADLCLAVRPPFGDGGLRCEKPASKLVNAWHAGVPSLLGREYAFRELRRSPLDYVEVTCPADALQAIDRLLDDPDRYARMVAHGRRRARAFTPRRIADRWADVLFERLPELARQRSVRWSRPLPLPARRVVNCLAAPPSPFEVRKRLGTLLRRGAGLLDRRRIGAPAA
jgi:hypothetical protein